jgi:rubredoxin
MDSTVSAAARLECKVCWHVYDPALGDPVWQIPPGTPFSALPEHWTCPICATPKDGFLLLSDE